MLNSNKLNSVSAGCGSCSCKKKNESEKWIMNDAIISPNLNLQHEQLFVMRKLDGGNGLTTSKRSSDDSVIMTTTSVIADDNCSQSNNNSRRRHSAAVTISRTSNQAKQTSTKNVTPNTLSSNAATSTAIINSRVYSEVISDGKSLCGQFIRGKLKRSGLFHKKFGLQRIRSIIFKLNDQNDSTYNTLQHVAIELEKMYPHIYSDVLKQTMKLTQSRPTTTSKVIDGNITCINTANMYEKRIHELFKAIALNIFRGEMTWSKVIAVYCVAGALAVDCVRESRPELINDILEAFTELLEIELAEWIVQNGGWMSLVIHYRKQSNKLAYYRKMYMFSAITMALIAIVYFYNPVVIMQTY